MKNIIYNNYNICVCMFSHLSVMCYNFRVRGGYRDGGWGPTPHVGDDQPFTQFERTISRLKSGLLDLATYGIPRSRLC